jgi:hypothetical protein
MNITIGSITVCGVCVGPSFLSRSMSRAFIMRPVNSMGRWRCYWEFSGATQVIINGAWPFTGL